jgi:hypothetical protein
MVVDDVIRALVHPPIGQPNGGHQPPRGERDAVAGAGGAHVPFIGERAVGLGDFGGFRPRCAEIHARPVKRAGVIFVVNEVGCPPVRDERRVVHGVGSVSGDEKAGAVLPQKQDVNLPPVAAGIRPGLAADEGPQRGHDDARNPIHGIAVFARAQLHSSVTSSIS